MALYRYNEENDVQPLYDPTDMRTFSEHHAPGLCKVIIALMTHTFLLSKTRLIHTFTSIYMYELTGSVCKCTFWLFNAGLFDMILNSIIRQDGRFDANNTCEPEVEHQKKQYAYGRIKYY